MDEPTQLLLDAADGDAAALAAFVRGTQTDVWRLCAYLVDPDAADDLTQEVYLRAMRGAERFRGEASARTWLLALARNVAADEIRLRQRRRRLPAPPAESAADVTGRVDLDDLVASLQEDRRVAFVLTQILGLTYAEAAETCDVAIGTIRSRVARARERLVELLREAERPDGETARGAPAEPVGRARRSLG